MLERRQHIFDVFKTMFQTDCVVITLGLTEVFRDVERDLYVSNALVAIGPLRRALGERLEFVDLDFETSLGFVRGALDLIWDMNPDAKILITVSPVSAKATFSGDDVILASMRSKALLHTVITEVIRNEPRAGYFPGFERIMLTRSWDVFTPDLRHVSDFAVKGVVAQLVQTYFEVDATQRKVLKPISRQRMMLKSSSTPISSRALQHWRQRILKPPKHAVRPLWDKPYAIAISTTANCAHCGSSMPPSPRGPIGLPETSC